MQFSKDVDSLLKRINRFLGKDFCPAANAYVYWLKEPVGWFVLAFACSLLIGSFVSPIGWSIAIGLAVVLTLGLGFPWLATRSLSCQLCCESEDLHEGGETFLLLNVRNPLPIPVIGLVIENYFPSAIDDETDPINRRSDCGLARVPALSSAEYRLPIMPRYRGRYPNGQPVVACGFPFGIYTSRRPISSIHRVIVRPLLLPLAAMCEFTGTELADVGEGNRPAHHGDYLGVREFQRGDSLRSIHWAQSARFDELVVCERGGPQKSPLEIQLSTARCSGRKAHARENLAWRVRIAASMIDLLTARHIPFRLWIDNEPILLPADQNLAKAAWEQLALVPLDSQFQFGDTAESIDWHLRAQAGERVFVISPINNFGEALSDRYVSIVARFGTLPQSTSTATGSHLIDLDQSIDRQLEQILGEASLDCVTV